MSKFFKTGNANRTYKVGGFVFEFERLLYQNGTWLGVLEEPKEDRAKSLKGFGGPISEITEDEFLALKKKPSLNSHISVASEPTETEPTETEPEAPAVEGSLENELDFKAPPTDVLVGDDELPTT